MSERRPRPVLVGAAVGVVVLVAMLVWFGRAAWGGWWMVDRSITADTYMLSAHYERWATQVRGGVLPFWFPEFACGYPAHAAWAHGMLNPALSLYLALPPEAAFAWLAILHVVLGALGMYALVWEERRDAFAAAAGAFVFALSGFMLGRVACGHLMMTMPFAWAPWVLRGALRTVRGVPGAAPWFGIVTGVALLAGHVQPWFYMAPLVAAAALVETARIGAWFRLPVLLGGVALAVGVAAIQWIPAAELFFVSGHPAENRDLVRQCSAPVEALAAQFAPRFAAPSDEPFRHEFGGLAGPLAVAGALLAFRLRDGRRWFWFVVLLLGLALATGLRTGVGELANELPPFRWARAPGRAMTLVVFAGAVLCGHLVADWTATRATLVRIAAPAAFLASALVFGVAAPDAVRADFARFDWSQAFDAGATEHRVELRYAAYAVLERTGVRTTRQVWPFDTPGFKALTDRTVPYAVVAWWFDVPEVVEMPPGPPPPDAAAAASRVALRKTRRFDHAGAAQWFPNAVHDASFDEVIARLRAGDRSLWVDEALEVDETLDATPRRVTPLPTNSPARLSYHVEPRGAGWVLTSEKWYPGWQYRDADGVWRPCARGNLAFLAVPAASATEIEYRPWWKWPALATSVASLVLAAVLVVVARRDPR